MMKEWLQETCCSTDYGRRSSRGLLLSSFGGEDHEVNALVLRTYSTDRQKACL